MHLCRSEPCLCRYEFASRAGRTIDAANAVGTLKCPDLLGSPSNGNTRVAAALRMAALSLRRSQTALGAYYRRIAQRVGGDVAVFATARKLATLIYRLLRWGQPYVDEGAQAYEARYHQQRLRNLTAKAKDLGYQLAPINA